MGLGAIVPAKIWLIGGTSDSAELARSLAAQQIPCLITVATETARSLYAPSAWVQVQVGRLTQPSVASFLQQHQIAAILDASHPFAVEISQLAIATAQQFQRPYLRYERPIINAHDPSRVILPDFPTLLTGDYLTGERVLLTIGYRWLPLLQPWQAKATLFARILPSVTALEAALAAGFTSDRLIALRPPLTPDLESALWQQWQISLIVTKASGTAGGEDVKRQISQKLGIGFIVIDRPAISYPQQTNDLEQVLAFCHASLQPG